MADGKSVVKRKRRRAAEVPESCGATKAYMAFASHQRAANFFDVSTPCGHGARAIRPNTGHIELSVFVQFLRHLLIPLK